MGERLDLDQPTAARDFVRRHTGLTPLAPALSAAGPRAAGALERVDRERVERGQRIIPNKAAVRGLEAARTMRPVTAEPSRGPIEGAIANIRDIGTSVFKIPGFLVDEVKAIPSVPAKVSEAVAAADDPLEALGNVASVPVMRMIPGAYIAQQGLADAEHGSRGWSELAENPVFTVLDVAPVAGKALKATKTVKAATEAAEQTAEVAGTAARRVRPMSTFTRNWRPGGPRMTAVDRFGRDLPAPVLEPNVYGQLRANMRGRWDATGPGRHLAAALGRESQAVTRTGYAEMARALEDPTDVAAGVLRVNDVAKAAEEAGLTGTPRSAEIARAVRTGDRAVLDTLTPQERRYVDAYDRVERSLSDPQVAAGELVTREYRHGPETLLPKQARNIEKAERVAAERRWFWDRYKELQSSSHAWDRAALIDELGRIHDDFRGGGLKSARAATAARAQMVAMGRAGLDVGRAMDELWAAKTRADLDGWFGRWAAGDTVSHPWAEAAVPHPALKRRAKQVTRDLQRAGKQWKSAQTKAAKVEAGTVPARWQDPVAVEVRNRMQTQVDRYASTVPAEQAADIAAMSLERAWQQLPEQWRLTRGGKDLAKQIRRDVAATWQDLAASGMEPRYVHRVSHTRMKQAASDPQPLNYIPSVSSLKERVWGGSETIDDLTVSVTHQALEQVRRTAMERFFPQLAEMVGVPADRLHAAYVGQAERAAAARGTVVADELSRIVGREWVRLDPAGLVGGGAGRGLDGLVPEGTFIPRSVNDNLRRMIPSDPKPFATLTDPVMGVFRTSVLALRPQWQINNIVSGAIMLTARGGPRTWTQARRAWSAVRAARRGEQALPEGLPPSSLRQDVEWFRSMDKLPVEAKAPLLAQFAAGNSVGRWVRQARESRVAGAGRRAVQMSYDANGFIDDVFRAMSYFDGQDRALRAGKAAGRAHAEGVEAARRALMEWDTMTPLERQGIRSVVPFYAFTRFLLRNALTYPVDHPWRLQVMESVARHELEDAAGLPAHVRDLLRVGGMDSEGNVTTANVGGMNPFRDVGSWAGLLGFMAGQEGGSAGALTAGLNPVVGSFLTAMGVDARSGAPELFGDVVYDPVTGGLKVESESFPLAVAHGLIPQAKLLTAAAGWNSTFDEMLASDPDGAMRYLVGSFGVPSVLRDRNMPEEMLKAEVRRFEAMEDDRRAAAESGRWEAMRRWPGLEAYYRQLQVASPEQLEPFVRPGPSGLADLLVGG